MSGSRIKRPGCIKFDVDGVIADHPPQKGKELQSIIQEYGLPVDPEVIEIRIDALAILVALQVYSRQKRDEKLKIKLITQQVINEFKPGTLLDEINHLLVEGDLVYNSELYIEIQSRINEYKCGPEYCDMVELVPGATKLPKNIGAITNNTERAVNGYAKGKGALPGADVFSCCDRSTSECRVSKPNPAGWVASFGLWIIKEIRQKQELQSVNPNNLYQNLTELRHLYVGDQPNKDAAMTNNVNSWLQRVKDENGNNKVQLKPEEWSIVMNYLKEKGATQVEIRMLLKLLAIGKKTKSKIGVDYLHIAPPSELELHGGIETIRQKLQEQFPNIPKITVDTDLVALAKELNSNSNSVPENRVVLLPKPVRHPSSTRGRRKIEAKMPVL